VKRIISKRALKEFWKKYPDSKVYLETWYETAKAATWVNPNEIKEFYASVSILKNSRVVFNICGNKFRLIVKINYLKQWIFIRFVGTHKEYDQIDANNI
jgi:mRNA interferase HigB